MRILTMLIICILSTGAMHAQTYEEWVNKSFDCLEVDDLACAEECLENALKAEPANPGNFALLTNLGTVQRMQGKPEAALQSYTAALARMPNNAGLLENRASLYVDLGQKELAIGDYTALLELQPLNEEAHYFRGLLYLEEGNYLAAEDDFERILEINDKTVRGRVGYALLEKKRGNYDDSERIYNYLIEKAPRDWSLYEGRADLYIQMGKYARAMADINKLFIETQPSAFLHALRGKAKLGQYEKEAAMIDFTKAIELGYDRQKLKELLVEEK
ncbi:tetratricopeptide (TPR) repeat protein [Parabacteroides sp. PFB2-12]|uniref:tetratricopeptide repeat protein n=1 Tax=unclassified Parabacteroides TaxID=2649774 RepID=UPI0024739A0E|nr:MULTISPECIES: tetratricopeptide repeat protein [unclassified Parabacteroides]MDH6344263.1 tetratricopeptide (TPR) repeat protein [Parabacteroides sp. PM6-13]MDH6391162.1 tetratricopeptide (TPR) repeat protein [Parabacteroides sp. PFB2-12]